MMSAGHKFWLRLKQCIANAKLVFGKKIDIAEFLSFNNTNMFKAQIHYPQKQCIRDKQVRHDLYYFYMYTQFSYIWLDKKTHLNYDNQRELFQKHNSLSNGSWLNFCSTNVQKHNKRLIILHKLMTFYRNVQAIYRFLSTHDFCDENADRRTDIQGLSNSL